MNPLHLSRIRTYDPDSTATLNTSGELFIVVSGTDRLNRMERLCRCILTLLPAKLSLAWQDHNGDECALFVDQDA